MLKRSHFLALKILTNIKIKNFEFNVKLEIFVTVQDKHKKY
jgi:hypothetical protein